jgi:signal transduction histidine kinase
MISLGRPPIDTPEPVVKFAALRVLLAIAALVALASTSFPYQGRLAVVVAVIALPWALAMLLLARQAPNAALSSFVAAGDIAVLFLVELIVPDTYAAVRFLALFFVAAHAQFQGQRGGLVIAAGTCAALVPVGALRDGPVSGGLLAFYEAIFSVCAFAAAVTAGNIRLAETAGRLRARELTRRMIETESEIRRRLAESIHDGPVQELVSLDMILTALATATDKGSRDDARSMLDEARSIAERNIQALRDEIVSLGPYAFRELSFETAVAECVPVWNRRYGIEVELDIEVGGLTPELNGPLFQIAQEAVTNAGRHAEASKVTVSLHETDGFVELRVSDNGKGFGDLGPLVPEARGHIGLASMRERAELINGELRIHSGGRGTEVRVRVPTDAREPARTPAPGRGR